MYKALHTHSTPAVKISQPLTWCPCYAHTREREHTTPNGTKKSSVFGSSILAELERDHPSENTTSEIHLAAHLKHCKVHSVATLHCMKAPVGVWQQQRQPTVSEF